MSSLDVAARAVSRCRSSLPDGCLTRENYVKLKEKTYGTYAGLWARVTKVIRDVGGGELMEREVYTEYGSFEEVGVLGDYSLADEVGAFKLTSEVTRDDHPIGGSSFPGVYELQQELRRCSEEEMKNMALAVEDEGDARKDKDQDDEDEKLEDKNLKMLDESSSETSSDGLGIMEPSGRWKASYFICPCIIDCLVLRL